MKTATQSSSRNVGAQLSLAGAALALLSVLALTLLVTEPARAQGYNYSVVYSFAGPPDAVNPSAGFVLDAQGNLYSTTSIGGLGGGLGNGTVYKVDVTGKETVLYSFTGIAGDGATPQGGVVLDAEGNLYGTTYYGGDLSCEPTGCGTVFKLDPAGNETILLTFTLGKGAFPTGNLLLDAQGNLYGTALTGGTNGSGLVFKLDASGVETVLGNLDSPESLIMDGAGNFYGTTSTGVFELTMSGHLIALHTFGAGDDGEIPNRGLAIDAKGNVYGTTIEGGYRHTHRPAGSGIVYKLDEHGNETILYVFCGPASTVACSDGAWPRAGLIRDSAGNLYGTTSYGGVGGNGIVFMLDPSGNETVLHDFMSQKSGAYRPMSGLAMDSQGNFYGTSSYGGADRGGTAFDLLTPAAATTTTVTATPNPSTVGEAVTFTAMISGFQSPVDGEIVSFMKSKTVLGTGTLAGGSASFTTSTLNAGTTSVVAVYAGDLRLSGSLSTVKQVVKKVKN
jgi:uncharacterized repeat protein (TIGR03803 family)